jgi:hypothetical protein
MSFTDLFNQIKQEAGDVDTSFEEKGKIGTGGSKFKIEEDGIYEGIIDMVVFKNSQSTGSAWYDVTIKCDEAKVSTKMFVLNKDGKPYNIDKNGQKKSTYGWNRMASLNYLINNEWDGLPVPEEKEVMVYDYEKGQEIAKKLPIVTSLIGKPVKIMVKMQLEDGYPDATQSRTIADVRGFLDSQTNQSSTEKRNGSTAQVCEDFNTSIAENPNPIDKRDKSKGSSSDAPFDADKSKASGFNFSS